MTDFFTRLAECTLGVAPIAQPRIASLFAPGPHVAFESPQEFAPLELQTTANEEFLPVRSQHTLPAVLQGTAPSVNPKPLVHDTRGTILAPEPVNQTTAADSPAGKSLRPEGKPLRAQGKRAPQPVHETSGSPLEEARDSLFVSGAGRPAIVPTQAAGVLKRTGFISTRSLHESVDALSPVSTSGSQLEDARNSLSGSNSRRPAITPSQAAEGLKKTDPIRTPSLNESADAFAPPVPAIRVTIGRVEVRAILPPAPAPRTVPSRSGSAPSLENYLKQRSGEGR